MKFLIVEGWNSVSSEIKISNDYSINVKPSQTITSFGVKYEFLFKAFSKLKCKKGDILEMIISKNNSKLLIINNTKNKKAYAISEYCLDNVESELKELRK